MNLHDLYGVSTIRPDLQCRIVRGPRPSLRARLSGFCRNDLPFIFWLAICLWVALMAIGLR